MDLAELQIGGAPIDPARVKLRATSCHWVHLEEMEKKCQPGDGFSINKVAADDLLVNYQTPETVFPSTNNNHHLSVLYGSASRLGMTQKQAKPTWLGL